MMVMVVVDVVWGGSCWYSGVAAGRQAGRQLPDEAAQALLFLLLLLLFLDPRNSEQAEAGAAPLLREGGRQKMLGDVNTSGCDVQH